MKPKNSLRKTNTTGKGNRVKLLRHRKWLSVAMATTTMAGVLGAGGIAAASSSPVTIQYWTNDTNPVEAQIVSAFEEGQPEHHRQADPVPNRQLLVRPGHRRQATARCPMSSSRGWVTRSRMSTKTPVSSTT